VGVGGGGLISTAAYKRVKTKQKRCFKTLATQQQRIYSVISFQDMPEEAGSVFFFITGRMGH